MKEVVSPMNNWDLFIRCKDCNGEFTPENVSYSVDVINSGRSRMIMTVVPNECPECRNLKLVPK